MNRPPEMDAGVDLSVEFPAPAQLQGRYVDSGVPATGATARWTYWRKVSGPGDVIFDDRYAVKTIAAFSMPGTYILELSGSDGGHLVRDAMNVRVLGADGLPR